MARHFSFFLRPVATAILAALMGLGLAAPSFASNHREVAPVGSSGTDAFNDVCRDGGFMIGFKVYLGYWFDHIQMICSDYFPDGTWRPRTVKGGYGGNGGSPQPLTGQCGDGWVLESLSIQFTLEYRQVRALTGLCRNMATGARTGKGSFFYIGPTNSPASFELKDLGVHCRENEAAAGFSGRYGDHVNALGLNCRKFPPDFKVGPSPSKAQPEKKENPVVGMLFCRGGGMPSDIGPGNNSLFVSFKRAKQSSTAAIPGPGECAFQDRPVRADEPTDLYVRLGVDGQSVVQTGKNGGLFLVSVTRVDQGFWAKTIHSVDPNWTPPPGGTGKKLKGDGGKAGFAAAEEPAGLDFTGSWSATTDDSTDYDLTLAQDGKSVTGDYTGSDGTSGTIKGTLKGKVLTFNWKQTDGTKGKGKFTLSGNGGSFKGSYSYDGGSGSWDGSRN